MDPPQDRSTATSPSEVSGSKAAPSMDWSKYPLMRLAIRFLHEDYPNISVPERLKIFNAVFSAELIECGFENGIADKDYEKIASQWRERNKSKNKASWNDITKWPTVGEEGQRFKQLREKVHEQAKEMGHFYLPVYNTNGGVGAVAGRGVRVAIKTRESVQDESSSEEGVEQKPMPKKKAKKAAR